MEETAGTLIFRTFIFISLTIVFGIGTQQLFGIGAWLLGVVIAGFFAFLPYSFLVVLVGAGIYYLISNFSLPSFNVSGEVLAFIVVAVAVMVVIRIVFRAITKRKKVSIRRASFFIPSVEIRRKE